MFDKVWLRKSIRIGFPHVRLGNEKSAHDLLNYTTSLFRYLPFIPTLDSLKRLLAMIFLD